MVFDVDKLKEALADWDNPPNSDETWESDRKMGQSLAVLAVAVRLVVAGQPSPRCTIHKVEVRWPDATNCVAGANNPESCELVEGWWMPTGGIWCDHEACAPEWIMGDTVAAARRYAEKVGWRHIDGQDFCPEHVPTGKDET